MTEDNNARWTITGLDSEYLWVLQRSLEMYADYLESLKPGPPKDNLKRCVTLGTYIIAERAGNPFGGTIDVSDIIQDIQKNGHGFRK
jgi:hypothetical protein